MMWVLSERPQYTMVANGPLANCPMLDPVITRNGRMRAIMVDTGRDEANKSFVYSQHTVDQITRVLTKLTTR